MSNPTNQHVSIEVDFPAELQVALVLNMAAMRCEASQVQTPSTPKQEPKRAPTF